MKHAVMQQRDKSVTLIFHAISAFSEEIAISFDNYILIFYCDGLL